MSGGCEEGDAASARLRCCRLFLGALGFVVGVDCGSDGGGGWGVGDGSAGGGVVILVSYKFSMQP